MTSPSALTGIARIVGDRKGRRYDAMIAMR
jgi:hypothetical protein